MKRKIEKDLMFIIESEIRTDLCILDKVERDVEVNVYLSKNLMDRLLEHGWSSIYKINNVYYVSRSNDMGEYYLTEVELID